MGSAGFHEFDSPALLPNQFLRKVIVSRSASAKKYLSRSSRLPRFHKRPAPLKTLVASYGILEGGIRKSGNVFRSNATVRVASSQRLLRRDASGGNEMKIVIIDDLARNIETMREVLAARGHDVCSIEIEWHTETSAEKLAADILAENPDRVLLDHDLKRDWTGEDVVKHLPTSFLTRVISTSSIKRARVYLSRYVDKDLLFHEWLSRKREWPNDFDHSAKKFCEAIETE